MKPLHPSSNLADTFFAAAAWFALCGPSVSLAQTLTQHWKMDEADLTYTGSLAPLVNEVSGGSAASVFNNADIVNSPVANQAGATAVTGTSILTRVRSQRIQLGNVAPATGSFTMALWFKRDGTAVSGHDSGSDQEHILSANQGQVGRWNLATGPFVNDSNFSIGWFHNGGFSPLLATGMRSGVWYHFAVTREMPSGTIKFSAGRTLPRRFLRCRRGSRSAIRSHRPSQLP